MSAHLDVHQKARDLGPDVRFPPMDDPPPGYVMRTTVARVGGNGEWG